MITWTERAKAAISQKGQTGTAKTDKTTILRLLAVSSVPTEAVSAKPEGLSSVLAVPSHAVMEKHDSSIGVVEDPDRWCWPHSYAMNGAEIDTFAALLHRFTDKGLPRADSEALAGKLVLRNRGSGEDRCVCMECRHFAGHGAMSWRCGNWKMARIAQRSSDAQLPADFVVLFQRCYGFTKHQIPHQRNEREGDAPR